MTETQDKQAPVHEQNPVPAQSAGAGAASPQFGLGDQLAQQQRQSQQSKVLWGIFALLLALAGGVFFVLPRYVGPAQPPAPVLVTPPAASPAAATALSPFEEAQRLRQREAAQNTLASLLALQQELEQKNVQDWAAAEFETGLDQARQGDEAYRKQDFETANRLYQQGVDTLQAILDGEQPLFDSQLAAGQAALLAGDARGATEAFTLALAIRPDNTDARQGLQRAGVLDQVLQLLASGRSAQAAADFDSARARFEEARTLDPANPEVSRALSELETAIANNTYASTMSRGYAALQAGRPAEAEEAFREAGNLRPGSAEVETALQQARDAATTARIKVHIDAATRFESEENWAAALREWQSALAADPNLVVAQQGQRRSENRRDLDVFLSTVMREPLRLSDDTIYEQTRQLLRDLESFEPKGPRLAEQVRQVDALMAQARVPLTVPLVSDGMTEVTLLRVATLGKFTQQTQSLLPGQYVAVGARPGYRDVRVEFTLLPGQAAPTITVICNETI